MNLNVVKGDRLDQEVDVIVNAWNRNVIPWWLLLTQGVSGAIKKRAGLAPFRELGKLGPHSICNAMKIVKAKGYESIAFPLIGAGSGGKKVEQVLNIIKDELGQVEFDGDVIVVCFDEVSI